MRLVVAAVGRMKHGPERDLAERYRTRAGQLGRKIGLRGPDLVELDESRARDPDRRRRDEADALRRTLPEAAPTAVLDQKGQNLSTEAFTRLIERWRADGRSQTWFVIGGPDGHAPDVRQTADTVLAFGALTWPHQIMRILLFEQIYRALTMLSGHPYHRA